MLQPKAGHIRGMTLVEILIVVLMLGILAMVVVPRFADAGEDAKETAVRADIQLLRRQVDLYRVEHEGRLPHIDENGNPDPSHAVDRLTGRTDRLGKITPNGPYGPYINTIPPNPFCDDKLVAISIMPGEDPKPPRNGLTGWYYCTANGLISANSKKGGEIMDPQ